MSEKEFEQGNEELFGVVNSHASDKSKRQAEQVVRKLQEEEKASILAHEKRENAKSWTKRICGLILRMLICTVAAGLFLAALLLPGWVPVLCFAGIAACLVVGAIVIDRAIRSWR